MKKYEFVLFILIFYLIGYNCKLHEYGFIKTNQIQWKVLNGITTQFLHGGLIHVLVNFLSLLTLWRAMLKIFSVRVLIYTYMGSLLFVSLVLCICAIPNIYYVGNSGVICSLYGTYFMKNIIEKNKVWENMIEMSFAIVCTFCINGVSPLMHLSGLLFGCVNQMLMIKTKKIIANKI